MTHQLWIVTYYYTTFFRNLIHKANNKHILVSLFIELNFLLPLSYSSSSCKIYIQLVCWKNTYQLALNFFSAVIHFCLSVGKVLPSTWIYFRKKRLQISESLEWAARSDDLDHSSYPSTWTFLLYVQHFDRLPLFLYVTILIDEACK